MSEIINSHITFGCNPAPIRNILAGVYMMKFDNGYFYVGSSKNLRQRIRDWRINILRELYHSKNIKDALPSCNNISFEILEFVTDKTQLRYRETFYIKNNWGNSFLLNRCPSGIDNRGMIFRSDERKQLSLNGKKRGLKDNNEWSKLIKDASIKKGIGNKIGKFNDDGYLIQIFSSVKFASSIVGIPRKYLPRIIRSGKSKYFNGFTLKYLNDDFTINIKIDDKQLQSLAINVYNFNDTFLFKFDSINKACRELGLKTGSVCKVLNGHRISHLGYKFKYCMIQMKQLC